MDRQRKISIHRWVRILHRDIGFFIIGLTIIYGISGIVLTYRDTGFLKSARQMEKTVSPDLRAAQLGRALHVKNLEILGEDEKEIRFSSGAYNKETGVAAYVGDELPLLLRKFNSLHFVSSNDFRHWFTALYAILLVFLAVSSFWMYKPGTKYFKRGIVTAIIGGAVALVLAVL